MNITPVFCVIMILGSVLFIIGASGDIDYKADNQRPGYFYYYLCPFVVMLTALTHIAGKTGMSSRLVSAAIALGFTMIAFYASDANQCRVDEFPDTNDKRCKYRPLAFAGGLISFLGSVLLAILADDSK